jgi:hypothetical protein
LLDMLNSILWIPSWTPPSPASNISIRSLLVAIEPNFDTNW